MADEITRLRNEITQLQQTIDSLANIPDVQEALQAQLAAKRTALAGLTSQNPTAVTGNTTNIQGNVTGPLLSGSFAGPVHVGGTTLNQGPQISGPISAGRDVNIGEQQTIINQGDSIQVGDISDSSGVAIGRGAQVNADSLMSHVAQSISAASHLDPQDADQLKALVVQFSAELHKYAAQHPERVEDVVQRTESAVAEAIKPTPDKEDVQYRLDRLTKAATSIGSLLPIATQLVEFIRALAG